MHVCLSASQEAVLSQLYYSEDNAAALEAMPQMCSKSPLDDFQMSNWEVKTLFW